MTLLDSGCQRMACGKKWLSNFISAIYCFGDSRQKKALRYVTSPRRFRGKRVNNKTDIIDYAVRLLMNRQSRKAAGAIINLAEDTPVVFGITVNFKTTSTGHYTLPLFSDALTIETNYLQVFVKSL